MLGESNISATIGVKDMSTAIKFYEDVLGLHKSESQPSGTYFRSGDSGIFVYPSEFAGTNKATYASWLVKDVDAVVTSLKEKNVTFEHVEGISGMTLEGDVHVMGDIRAAWFKDPDGNILNIVNRMG